LTAGELSSAERGKVETESSVNALYELMSCDDQQSHYSTTSTSDDAAVQQSQLSTLFIAAAASSKPPTSAASAPATSAGNPIDKLYSMQTSYFTAN